MDLISFIIQFLIDNFPQHPIKVILIALPTTAWTIRAVLKVAFDGWRQITKATPDPKDDAVPDQVEKSPFFTGLFYFLDLFIGIKLKNK